MKKVLRTIGAGLLLLGAELPSYGAIAAMLVNYDGYNQSSIPIMTLTFVLGLACAITFLILSHLKRWSAHTVALGAMRLKLVRIPIYALGFTAGVIAVFKRLWFILFALWFLIVWISVSSGIVGLAAVLRRRDEGVLTETESIIHGILQFVFCADVVSAIIVYRKSKEVSL